MVKGLVTVVLPIYNVEKYLDRCIESVVGQTYENIEILLIDDGSTDSSSDICDRWLEKDNRIRVIHKKNQGLGMARNTGIENSRGEYICFFDSDDFIDTSAIEKTYNRAVKDNSDVVAFGLHFADEQGRIISSFIPPLGDTVYEGNEVQDFFIPEITAPNPNGNGVRSFYMSTSVMLYSMSLIEKINWRFVSEREIISEDVYSLLKLFKFVNKVSVIAEAFYYYCRNESSLSRTYRADRFGKVKDFYNRTVEMCKELEYSEEILHRVTKPYLAFTIAALKQESTAPRSNSENIKRIKELINDETLQSVLERNKKDNVSFNRRMLFFAMRNKMNGLCYLLLRLKANQ